MCEEVYNTFNEFLISDWIQWPKCIGISTDEVHAMSGRLTGLLARIRENDPTVAWHLYCIVWESLATKKMLERMKKSLNESVKIVYFIKARSLNPRLFEQLCPLWTVIIISFSSIQKSHGYLVIKVSLCFLNWEIKSEYSSQNSNLHLQILRIKWQYSVSRAGIYGRHLHSFKCTQSKYASSSYRNF